MRKLILQIRYTIFSRLLCVRHLQTILPYSPYLYGIFTIYSNFTPHTRIYFCKAESFFAELELTFSIHQLMYESEKQVVMHHFAAEISTYKVTALRCLLLDYKVKNHKKAG